MIHRIIIFITLIIILGIFYKKKEKPKMLNKTFYNYKDVYPFLDILKNNRKNIKKEVENVIDDGWKVCQKNIYIKIIMDGKFFLFMLLDFG